MIAYDGAPLGDQSHNVCQASSINGQNKGRFCSSDEHADTCMLCACTLETDMIHQLNK
jgi:hypothetical protein